MNKVMTASELVAFGRKYVKAGTSYGKGMQLCPLNKTNIDKKAKQYNWYVNPTESSFVKYGKKSGYTDWREYLLNKGKAYGADCCGWIKRASYGNSTYNPTRDITIKAMANECTDVVTDYKKAVPGMLMWGKDYGHVALYVGDGKCIESAPSCDGMAEHKWNYQGSNYYAGFGKLPWVDYGASASTSTSLGKDYVVYNCYWVNVRKGAGLLNKALTQLKAGTKVKVYATKNGWAKISPTEEKWVSLKCLKEC